MNKKFKKSRSKTCVTKRPKSKLALIISNFVETIWAVGASVAAAMAISTSTL